LEKTGKLCRETSCPPWQALFGFREHVRVRARSRAERLSRCLPCHGGGVMRGPSQDASHPSDREAGLPAHAQAASRKRGSRELKETAGNTGHSILHRCFYVIGAQSSGPSGGDCTLPRSPGLDCGRTALLGPAGPRAVLHTWMPAFLYCCPAKTEAEAPELCSTPGFLRGAVSGAREISNGALLPHVLHETIRPDFEDRNARCLFLRSR
jgi:hypothetical protein